MCLSGCRNTVAKGNQSAETQGVSPTAVNGIAFEEVAAQSGLHYTWPQQPRPLRNLEAFGCGCAFLDYDGDGWQDIILIGKPTVALFHNEKNGQFRDVTQATGLAGIKGDWKGCAIGDYDSDGFPDLLLTGYHCLALMKNDGGQRWINVTTNAGLDPHDRGHWGSSAGFMDLDGNGTLDLVLSHYVIFGPKEKQYCYLIPGIKSGCPPREYRPEFAELWQNLGNGKFKELTATSGLKNTHGKALVVAFADVNDDGRMDFFIGNDGTPAELMLNLGNMHFKNIGVSSGAAYGALPGQSIAAMGADWADYDRDGRLDLTVTAFSDEPYSLLHSIGPGLFEHTGDKTGITGPTLKALGFGAKWIDVDNDGWPDIIYANGHVYDSAGLLDPLSPFRQPLMLFHNQRGHKFVDLAPSLDGAFIKPILGRGSATGDYDNDGRMDMLVVDYEGNPLLLHNISQNTNHWVTFNLWSNSPNHLAYGAKVIARAGKSIWIGQVSPASSYLSSSDPRIHFGLGTVTSLDSVTIQWPSGQRVVLQHVTADRILNIIEGKGIVEKITPHP